MNIAVHSPGENRRLTSVHEIEGRTSVSGSLVVIPRHKPVTTVSETKPRSPVAEFVSIFDLNTSRTVYVLPEADQSWSYRLRSDNPRLLCSARLSDRGNGVKEVKVILAK